MYFIYMLTVISDSHHFKEFSSLLLLLQLCAMLVWYKYGGYLYQFQCDAADFKGRKVTNEYAEGSYQRLQSR
jgi:hypothetical protein